MSNFQLPPDIMDFGVAMPAADAEPPILTPPVRAAVHQWMTEIRAEDDLRAVNLKPRRSALLGGPPGCGKTTLAHHVAARLGLPLVCAQMEPSAAST